MLWIGHLTSALSNGALRLALLNPSKKAQSRRPTKSSEGNVTDYFPPDDVRSHFLLSIGLARPNRGNLGECEDVYWLSAMVDRNDPPPLLPKKEPPPRSFTPLPAAKRLIHVWLSDVNRGLFLEMLVRI